MGRLCVLSIITMVVYQVTTAQILILRSFNSKFKLLLGFDDLHYTHVLSRFFVSLDEVFLVTF